MATTAASLQVHVGADIAGALSGLNKVSKSVSGFTADIGKTAVGVGIATLGLDAFGGVADLLKQASGVGLARDFEDVNAQLTAMLGSGDAAAAMMGVIRERADATPFGFLELSKAAAGLVPIIKRTGAPLNDLLNTQLALASFDPAQGLEGAGIALREFASGDITSLRRRFEIDTDPIEKLIAKGVPGLKALNTVLAQSGIDLGLVEARAKTTGGRLNTFGDLLGSISLEAGKPILAAFGVELDRTSGLITANLPALKDFAKTIGTRVAGGVNTLGTELGTVFQTATNIASVHGVPFLDALGIASELRIGEVFGDKAQKDAHGFMAGIRGIPETLGAVKKFFETDFAKTIGDFKTTIETTFGSLERTFALFFIGLADVPGLGALKDEAEELRRKFGIPTVTPGITGQGTAPGAGFGQFGGTGPGGLPTLSDVFAGRGDSGATYNQNFHLDLSGLDPRNPADAEEIARRMADLWAKARRRTAASTGPDAPGA